VPLLDAVTQVQPNDDSTGIVYLNALLARIFPFMFLVSLTLLAAYWIAFSLLLNTQRVSSAILFLPFSGLMPYLVIPSKEAFLVLGILLLILAYLDHRFLLAGAAGLLLVYLARPDAAYFLLLSCLLASLHRFRWLLAALLLGALVAYFLWLRPLASTFAEFEQAVAFRANNGFCNLGPLSVCVGSAGNPEVVYLERIFSLGGLPLKWIWEGFSAFFAGLTISAIVIRIALVVQVVWAYWVFSKRGQADERAAMVRRAAAWFGGLYFLLYGAIVYFQSTRQLVFVSSIVVIGWCVRARVIDNAIQGKIPLENGGNALQSRYAPPKPRVC
jgi:hypothetical protein